MKPPHGPNPCLTCGHYKELHQRVPAPVLKGHWREAFGDKAIPEARIEMFAGRLTVMETRTRIMERLIRTRHAS